MKTSAMGIALIQEFENFEPSAYPDPGSTLGQECARCGLPMRDYRRVAGWMHIDGAPWTVGYGHTGRLAYAGQTLSMEAADELLREDLAEHERAVVSLVKVPLTQGQFDALVSFAFNVGDDIDGDDIAEGLGDSTLLKRLNEGNYLAAATEFLKWDKCRGKVLRGLTRRRQAERELFLSGVA